MTLSWCRAGAPARRLMVQGAGRLSGLCLDLSDFAGSCAANGNAARLHGLGDFALQLDKEQPALEARASDLDMVGKRKLALEVTGRDAAMQEGFSSLSAFFPSRVRTFSSAVSVTSSGVKPASATEIWKRFSSSRSILYGWKLSSAVRWTGPRRER
jgi:hypothetical protein